jgi:hypothetical protein
MPRVSFPRRLSLDHSSTKEQNANSKIFNTYIVACTSVGDKSAGRGAIIGDQSLITISPYSGRASTAVLHAAESAVNGESK